MACMEKTTSATALRSADFEKAEDNESGRTYTGRGWQAIVVFKAEAEEGRQNQGDDDDEHECRWTQEDFRQSHGDCCGLKSGIDCCKARSAMI